MVWYLDNFQAHAGNSGINFDQWVEDPSKVENKHQLLFKVDDQNRSVEYLQQTVDLAKKYKILLAGYVLFSILYHG